MSQIPLKVLTCPATQHQKTSSSSSLSVEEEFPVDADSFLRIVGDHRVPVILRGVDLGLAQTKWTSEYLISATEEVGGTPKKVKVHRSFNSRLDFRRKNFSYETVSFSELVRRCSDQGEKEFWYLRSLGEDPRGKDVSDLSVHFPELYKDLNIPTFFPDYAFFSSVFRITSPQLQLWTHYDTCDNILIQIRGRKRIVLFPPEEALNLYLDGDKSQVLDIDEPDLEQFPDFKKAVRYEGVLEEGDIIFIPALWFHNITALDFSISVNVFWKNLPLELYDKKDTYGNRDVIPAQLALKTFEKSVAQLKVLPKDFEDFYLRRMIVAIQKRLDNLEVGARK